jgi:signal transduction histidine kinase
MSRFAATIASAFRRYAAWLVAISWKRFILLSVLLLIIAGVASNIPPFTWTIMETAPKVSSQEGAAAGASLGEEIRREIIDEIGAKDESGDRAKRKSGRRVRLGDYLPNFAFLFIIVSAAIKIAYAGRVKAEAKAAEAQEIAEAESLKRQVVEARMAAMQAQVEPHFLFNTLASIDHLIEVDPPRASRMQKNLIALLRASMPAMREAATTLGRELQVVRPYLEILKVRMEDRLRAEINVAEGLYSADFPPMMLQSLVENAIKHGLEPKPEGGTLRVDAEVAHGKLVVSVADTGVGFGRAATVGTGTGLNSIRERLKLIYGSPAELRIAENAPTGTRVTVVVPYRTA